VRLSGTPGSLAQSTTLRFGSASMIATLAPVLASSEARIVADVVFPEPPFGDENTMTGIGTPHGWLVATSLSLICPRKPIATKYLLTVD
jgi:hypothetical protein